MIALLLISDPNFASAATGGRSGGSLFPSGGDSSSSSSSSSSWSGSSGSSDSWSWHHSPSSSSSSSSSSDGGLYVFLVLMAVVVGVAVICRCAGVGKTSVVKLQVGLVGKARSLQKDLNRLTETTDMSTSTGLSHLLTGASTSLLRNLDYCISSYSSSETEDAEQCFKQLSMEEAAKFDEVTLTNVNNFIVRSTSQSPNEGHKEYIVVTILVATRGGPKFPSINGPGDLKRVLQSLGSIPSNQILAVEVLWTPQQENDTLTEKELLKDYLQLRGFYDGGSLEEGPYDDSHPFLGVTVVKS